MLEGRRVVVDASFREEGKRLDFLRAARQLGVPCFFLLCQAPRREVKTRLGRRSGGVSDADWTIYCEAEKRWEDFGPELSGINNAIATTGTPERTLGLAIDILKAEGCA